MKMYPHLPHAPKTASQSEFLKSLDDIRLPNSKEIRRQKLDHTLCD
jgi:hypothetical protein